MCRHKTLVGKQTEPVLILNPKFAAHAVDPAEPFHSVRQRARRLCPRAAVEGFFKEAFFPGVKGQEPPMMGEALMARVMAAAPKYGLELLPPA